MAKRFIKIIASITIKTIHRATRCIYKGSALKYEYVKKQAHIKLNSSARTYVSIFQANKTYYRR